MKAAAIVLASVLAIIACSRDRAPPSSTGAPPPPIRERDGTIVRAPERGPPPYRLAVDAPDGRAGAPVVVRVSLRPAAGYHMSPGYPHTRLAVTAPAGVTATRPVLAAADAVRNDDAELAFAIELVADRPGTYSVAGEVQFAVCTEAACLDQRQPLALSVAVR